MHCLTLMLYACADTCDPARGSAAFALGAAAHLQAHLTVMAPHNSYLPPSWEARSSQDLEGEELSLRQANAALAEAISAQAHEKNVSVSTQTSWAHALGLTSFIRDQAKLHDYVITGTNREYYPYCSERHIAEHVLFDSGRPVIVIPSDYTAQFSCERVTVAWDHSRGAARALHDALPLLRSAKQIVLVAIGGEKRFQTDLDPETIVTGLAKKGLNVRFGRAELSGRPIGEAIRDFARENGPDLLVMGAYGHSRIKEFFLGGATREILEDPGLPVLLSN